MIIQNARLEDFEAAFTYIEKLWSYNHYDPKETKTVYERVITNADTFAFFLLDDNGKRRGFCHGDFLDTFWMCGPTCYISSLIIDEDARRKGFGSFALDHVKQLAAERGCKALILDSGLPRTGAHAFYEHYGFEKSCFGFELILS